MIKLENPNGYIEVTNNYFATLSAGQRKVALALQVWLIPTHIKA